MKIEEAAALRQLADALEACEKVGITVETNDIDVVVNRGGGWETLGVSYTAQLVSTDIEKILDERYP